MSRSSSFTAGLAGRFYEDSGFRAGERRAIYEKQEANRIKAKAERLKKVAERKARELEAARIKLKKKQKRERFRAARLARKLKKQNEAALRIQVMYRYWWFRQERKRRNVAATM